MGISTVRLKGGKPWRLGPQAHADLQERGGWRAGGAAPLDASFSSCFAQVHLESVKPAAPLAERS